MTKRLSIGIGAMEWGDDEAALKAKFPRAPFVRGRTSVDPRTGERMQLPDRLVVSNLVPATDWPWDIELVDGRVRRVVLSVDAPGEDDEDEADDWRAVWDEMMAVIAHLAEDYGFAPVEIDGDRTWQHDGVELDFRVEGDTYILAIMR